MDKITLFDKTFKTFISSDELEQAISAVADRINKDFEGCTDVPVILCVLNGAMPFASSLLLKLDFDCELASVKLKSYSGTSSTGDVKQMMGFTTDVKGRRVIVVEDIVDTGNTIVSLKQQLEAHNAADVRICTMLLKPDVYDKDLKLDYVAKEIPNKFIVGYGLDYNEIGRNYKDIYILDE